MYALVDCNNFYVSCERVFNPALNGRPVIVLSNNDGCVIARSNEAKALDIKMGAPAFFMRELIEQYNIAVYSSNYTLYGDMSGRVMAILGRFAAEVEIYSIDEAFLDLSRIQCDLKTYGDHIRETTTRATGIPVSIGIAPTKTLAKIANRLVKKRQDGSHVFILDTAEKIEQALKNTEIGDVWGIGGQYTKMLNSHNVLTAHDFIQLPGEFVRQKMSVVGLRTQKELTGLPCADLELLPPPKKNICTSRSFGAMQRDLKVIEEAVATYTARCAQKLRAQKSCANYMQVFIETNQFREQDPQYEKYIVVRFPVATNSTIEMTKYALFALRQIFKPGYNYKKAGVIVCDLVPENEVQIGLFDHLDREKHSRIMSIMDKINSAMGRDTLRLAKAGDRQKWKLRQEMLSPCYTTRWKDIIEIKL